MWSRHTKLPIVALDPLHVAAVQASRVERESGLRFTFICTEHHRLKSQFVANRRCHVRLGFKERVVELRPNTTSNVIVQHLFVEVLIGIVKVTRLGKFVTVNTNVFHCCLDLSFSWYKVFKTLHKLMGEW